MGESRRSFLKKLFLADNSAGNEAKDTLVCIFLRGGADTLNMFYPFADDDYYKVRPTLAISKPGSNKANCGTRLNDMLALHPKLSPIYPMFAEGELALIQAVGTDNPSGSHFEVQDQMEHGEAYGHTIGGGWLGRYLRSRATEQLTPLSAVAIGVAVPESFRGAPVLSVIRKVEEISINSPSACTDELCKALSSMYGHSDLRVLSSAGVTNLDLLKRVDKIRKQQYKPSSGADYADDEFSDGLKELARLIKADVGLEVACIDLNGWDTHFVQGAIEGLQPSLIESLGKGLAAFHSDLRKCKRKVNTIVMTEFGRRTYENGSLGTDHGRGFTLMVFGSSINGGKIYGHYPGLEDDQYALGPGGLRITTDYRAILAELLSAHKVSTDLVFPGFKYSKMGFIKEPEQKREAV